MKRIIWNIGKMLQHAGSAMQKASGWKPKRARKGTGNPPGRPHKRKPDQGTPLPLEEEVHA